MYDSGKVVTGLIIFVGFFTSPMWLNFIPGVSNASFRPEPERADPTQECILPIEEIRVEHMQILDDWRNEAIREGNRTRASMERAEHHPAKSLTLTCMSCHPNREEFCDECHDFAGVSPYCFDCHTERPAEGGE